MHCQFCKLNLSKCIIQRVCVSMTLCSNLFFVSFENSNWLNFSLTNSPFQNVTLQSLSSSFNVLNHKKTTIFTPLTDDIHARIVHHMFSCQLLHHAHYKTPIYIDAAVAERAEVRGGLWDIQKLKFRYTTAGKPYVAITTSLILISSVMAAKRLTVILVSV